MRKLFVGWLEASGDNALKAFWAMAAGKATGSPFGESMESTKKELDDYLKSQGKDPDRRDGDVVCEIRSGG